MTPSGRASIVLGVLALTAQLGALSRLWRTMMLILGQSAATGVSVIEGQESASATNLSTAMPASATNAGTTVVWACASPRGYSPSRQAMSMRAWDASKLWGCFATSVPRA